MQLTKLIFPKTYLFVFLNAHRFVLWIMHGGALDPAHIYRAQWRADILDWLAMLAHENQKPTSKPR